MSRAEIFLQKYRILEGLLEKRYEGRRTGGPSVVYEYIRDEDSEPVRVDLDLLREIRNLLSHNACDDGNAVVEPSQEMIDRLEAITEYVRRPREACKFGTPASQVLSAHMNDSIYGVMRNMCKNGYSHVPVTEQGSVVGVFSVKSVFDYLADAGLDSLAPDARIAQLGDRIRLNGRTGERYMFIPADTSIISVRKAFERYTEKNSRLGMVFVTETGSASEQLICMLTPWDVLSVEPAAKEGGDHGGKAELQGDDGAL